MAMTLVVLWCVVQIVVMALEAVAQQRQPEVRQEQRAGQQEQIVALLVLA
jgi:hypothetical protein